MAKISQSAIKAFLVQEEEDNLGLNNIDTDVAAVVKPAGIGKINRDVDLFGGKEIVKTPEVLAKRADRRVYGNKN